MAEVPESTAAAMTEATARSAEAVSATTLYRRSGPGGTSISFSEMPFSSNLSDPCAFQQQLSAVQQQQQLVLQRPSVSVSGSTTRAASSILGAASQHQ